LIVATIIFSFPENKSDKPEATDDKNLELIFCSIIYYRTYYI
jgi:hypothetical protein